MNDPMLKIAVCNHRNNSKYKNQEKPWSYIKDRNRRPIRTTETAEEYPRLPKEKRDELKDHGGFVGGWLKGGIRKNGNVISRCIGALDADNIGADDDFLGITRKALEGVEYFIYSTHKHRPEAPRYRIVILFDREVSEDEYPALMRMVARQIGMDFFDDSTYQLLGTEGWSADRLLASVCGKRQRDAQPDPRQWYDHRGEVSAEVLGLPAFDEAAFLERVDRIEVDAGMVVTFILKDGSKVERKWDTRRPPSKWSEERRARFEAQPKRTYSPERRQQMSEHMKQLRKERGANWRKEKS